MRWKKAGAGVAVVVLGLSSSGAAAWASGHNVHDGMEARDPGSEDAILSNQSTLDFGQVCADDASHLPVTVEVVRGTATDSNNNYADDTVVSITSVIDLEVAPAGTSLAASDESVTTSEEWEAEESGTVLAATSTVTVTAGAALGNFEFRLRFRGNGANANNGNTHQVQSHNFKVAGEVVACSTDTGKAAPAIANEFLKDPAGGPDLEQCRENLGTNKNGANWRGNLISAVAQEFNNSPDKFNESAVQAFVSNACANGLPA